MIVTFISDFGIENNFAAVVKGIILSSAPETNIVDVTHAIPPFSIIAAGYTLYNSYKYFPKGTLHLVIVDPGVGTTRNIILAEFEEYYFVLPDNGIISVFGNRMKSAEFRIYHTSHSSAIHTFDGKNFFAPFVAQIITHNFTEKLTKTAFKELHKIAFPVVSVTEKYVLGNIILIDHFGNVITDIKPELLVKAGFIHIRLNYKELSLPFVPSYAFVNKTQSLSTISSFNTLELALNQASFAKKYNLHCGDLIKVLH